ncbi:alpha/beta hydrolase [Amycolatopsis rubida]|uniref:Alpha/beta hydrolase n=1 Tax=Amycolatopsis rubida TaxID=112413 RepID=A0ABX0C4I8_9PSEU|nr:MULTISPECIES: alpha/beta hydrolase [Amycolatopsis]MYW97611.1 alpha/beta fold hydrolase [Amycolatopsis rubida]NEC62596.1 alpha/beta hydrolase [Amycolatopsis rubida]OAP27387.1 3-oxoadipate enol-lactonase 2 [Amycolatopsis sp. M39]
MTEQTVEADGITLCHESFGDPDAPPLLLVMGLAAPMIWWDDEFCAQLAAAGFHVHRFDNRDVGRSQWWTGRASLPLAYFLRSAPYSLGDLADDAGKLLDALEIESAHVVGTSMGGMIAQEFAIRHPQRVRTLTSIMSTTGARTVGLPSPRAALAMLAPGPRTREDYVTQLVRTSKLIGSREYQFDEDHFRQRAERTYDRGLNPAGVFRQLAAILSSRDRTADLRRLSVPSLVIHGTADPLVHRSGGRATARALGADLDLVPGMGHDLPREVWPRVIAGIKRLATR